MTGFAFYSCEDVVDNPAQDPAQSWNYSVSVKFDNFDLSAAPGGLTYKAPTTLYVLNEENTLMGTITTETAPAADSKTYATYAGTLTGTIGNNLILATKIGNDLAKQDGTLESAIENGIVQTAEVPIKIYNANSGTLTTAAAKMENSTAIAHGVTGQIKGGDKISFVAGDQAFEWTVNEEFDPTVSPDLYIAIPTNADPEAEYTISTDSKDGFTRGVTFKLTDYPAIAKGKVSLSFGIPFIETGVDLTIWDAYKRKNDAGYMNDINNGYTPTFDKKVDDGKTFIITQSGPTLDSLNVFIHGITGKEINVTLNNIRLGKDRQIQFGTNDNWFYVDGPQNVCEEGATTNLTLIGETKTSSLYIACPLTIKGTGTIEYTRLSLDSYGRRTRAVANWSDMAYTKAGAATFTIDKDMDLEYISVADGATLNIADGKKLTITNDKSCAIYNYNGTIKVGKSSTLEAITNTKETAAIYFYGGTIDVGEEATFNTQAGKDGYGMSIQTSGGDRKIDFIIGKKAHVKLVGGPKDILGIGLYIKSNYNAINNITLAEDATLTAIGIDKYGIYCDNDNSATVNFNIGKNAKIKAEDTNGGYGIYTDTDNGFVNFDGEGTFEAKSASNYGMALHTWGGAINIKGGNISAIGGADKAAITSNNLFTIAPEIKSFKATKGAEATLYIEQSNNEVLIDNLVADKTKFNDETADGVRTITPKAE